MISRTTKQFWKLYEALPLDIQERANKAYAAWQSNPNNPGLHFKCVDPVDPIYSVRIGLNYRVVGVLRGDIMTWYWIGKHETYDRLLREEAEQYIDQPASIYP